MAKYKSYRGKWVDMEELRRSHEKTVASGNMKTNANGDTLGPGGVVVQTAQAKARKHYSSKETSKTTVSIKGDQNSEKVFEDEKVSPKVPAESDNTAKTNTKRKVEKETESGDIVLEDEE